MYLQYYNVQISQSNFVMLMHTMYKIHFIYYVIIKLHYHYTKLQIMSIVLHKNRTKQKKKLNKQAKS